MGAACSETDGGIPATVVQDISPASMPMTGGVAVEIRDSTVKYALDHSVSVTIGGIQCLEPKLVNRNHIRCYCQGHPQPGAQDVVVQQTATDTSATYSRAITFEPARDAAISSIWAIGGSTSAGVESGSLYLNMQVQSPVVQLARALGIFIGLPLISSEGLPIKSAICSADPNTGEYTVDYSNVLALGVDDIAGLRYDPDIEVRNLAVPHGRDARWLMDEFPEGLAGIYAHLVMSGGGGGTIMQRLPKGNMDVLVVGPDIWQSYIDEGNSGDDLETTMDDFFAALAIFAADTPILVADVPDRSLAPGVTQQRLLRYRTMIVNRMLRQRLSAHQGMMLAPMFEMFRSLSEAADGTDLTIFGQRFGITHGETANRTLRCAVPTKQTAAPQWALIVLKACTPMTGEP